MTDTNRVQRWREAKRQAGKKAVTVWLTSEEELRLKDTALTWHCSPSEMMQRAWAHFHPDHPQHISAETDTLQIRQLIREELVAMQAALVSVTDTVMDTVTVTTPGTTARETNATPMPTMAHVTDTGNGNVTDTECPAPPPATSTEDIQAARAYIEHYHSNAGVQEGGASAVPAAARPRRGIPKLTPRQVKALRAKRAKGAKVEMLMAQYGISKATVFRYLA